jgi:protein-disulfide isomerase
LAKSLTALGIAAVIVVGVAGYFLVVAPHSNQSGTQVATSPPATTAPAQPAAPATPATPPAATGSAQPSAPAQPAAPSTPPAEPPKDQAAGTQAPSASTTAPPAASSTTPAPEAAVAPPPAPGQPEIRPDDHVLGKADAPVTIIEYASMTCPHCARFHNDVMPRVKSELVEKGLARVVFRPFPLDQLALKATLLAQCAPGDGYFSMLAILFRSQQTWEHADDPVAALKQIGRTAGLSEDAIGKCLDDKASTDQVVKGMQEAQDKFKVNATPTFIINGKTYPGEMPFDDTNENGVVTPGFNTIVRNLLPKS